MARTLLPTLVILTLAAPAVAVVPPPESSRADRLTLEDAYGNLPWRFEPNGGQWHPDVRFVARGRGFTAFLTSTEIVLHIGGPAAGKNGAAAGSDDPQRSAVLRIQLVGANGASRLEGEQPLPGKVNYYIGNDPARWRSGLPTYATVRNVGAYPGIDVVYHGVRDEMEYDFIVAPGADPDAIRLRVIGAEALQREDGALVFRTPGGSLRLPQPEVFQHTRDGKRVIAASYTMQAPFEVGFALASYDRTMPLVIDPLALVYSTYLGGDLQDYGQDIAVSNSAFAYVTGKTESTDFPVAGPQVQPGLAASYDAFVTKLTPAGSTLVYSSYFGGSGDDDGIAIAISQAGVAYVGGLTFSPNFPILNAFQPTFAGFSDGFLMRLSPAGILLSSTYLGGDGNDAIVAVALWQRPSPPSILGFPPLVGILGSTNAEDFPTVNAFQPALNGPADSFVVVMNPVAPPASQLIYSTFLGGAGQQDDGDAITFDAAGLIYVVGETSSTDFPTASPYQPAHAGSFDAFVVKIDHRAAPAGQLVYGTFLGGSLNDFGRGIALDNANTMYLCGITFSTDFPIVNAIQPVPGDPIDAYVAALDASGANLAYATYLGGNASDACNGLTADAGGNAYVVGETASTDFPVLDALPGLATNAGDGDAFVTKLRANGQLAYSTYLGGASSDSAAAVARDGFGDVYVTGITASSKFPTRNPFQAFLNGSFWDAFVTRIREHGSDVVITIDPHDVVITLGEQVMSLVTLTNNGPAAGAVDVLVKARGPEFLLVDVSASQGACTVGKNQQAFMCSLGTIYPGTHTEIQIIVEPLAAGAAAALQFTAHARLRGRELVRADNTAVQTIMVR